MNCRYCSNPLAALRSLTDGEFCCDEHRAASEHEQLASNLTAFQTSNRFSPDRTAIPYGSGVAANVEAAQLERAAGAPSSTARLSVHPMQALPEAPPLHSGSGAAESQSPASEDRPVPESSAQSPATPRVRPSWGRQLATPWNSLILAWKTAPVELRVLTLLLPVLLAVALSPGMPKINPPNAAKAVVKQKVADQLQGFSRSVSNRAAIAITDDFRSGLDAWESRSNLSRSWSFDATGFVQPGPLAILKPTSDMTDYHFEFLSEVQNKALGAAFRAVDLDNYYAVKLEETTTASMPSLRLVRYAVIHGKEGPHVEKALPLSIRADMLNRIMVDVRGSDFTIMAQGEIVDFFSDSRLQRGGVGFFCSRGEKARLRWVEVSHQYDTLGRLCAFLVPYGLDGLVKR